MNILITRLQNIGDMLVFVPALRLLRETASDARITLLTKHLGGIEIIKNSPYFDDIITVNNRSLKEKLRLIYEFRKRKLDCFIISPQDLGRCPWGLMGGARKIVGFQKVFHCSKWKSEKLSFMLEGKPEWNIEASETENSVNLIQKALESVGIRPEPKPSLRTQYSWFLPGTPAIVSERIDTSAPYITVAPFSKQDNKNWSLERLAHFLRQLQSSTSLQIILVGGPRDVENCATLAQATGENCSSMAGEFSLDESAWVIHKARLFFGPDSGPAHLATAVETPAVVLYGPADYKRWRIADPGARRADLLGADSNVNNITIDEALQACLELLS